MDGKRRMIVRVAAEFIEGLCSATRPGRWFRGDGGVPPDAKCVGVNYDPERNCFLVAFEHDSFPLVHPGCCAGGHEGPTFSEISGNLIVRDMMEGRMTVAELADCLKVPATAFVVETPGGE